MALADIPFYGAFTERKRQNEAAPLAELQQVGAALGLREKLQAAAKARMYEAEVAKLGPNPSQEQLVALVSRFNPEKAMEIRQRTLDRETTTNAAAAGRQAGLEQQATLAREREEARIESARQQGANARMLAQMRIDADERMRRFMVANRPPVQPPAGRLLQTDTGPMSVDRNNRATPITGPDDRPLGPKTTARALPTAAAQKLFENQQNLRRAETALALIEGKDVGEMKGDPNATGWKGFLPDTILQRMDPKGTDARAALSDLGSLVIHERSGAAVTAAEFPRLMPFIPKINDDPETVKKKLKRFAQIYRDVASETANFYRESGYKVPELQGGGGDGGGPSVESLLEKYK
jgi:hypothetical protein